MKKFCWTTGKSQQISQLFSKIQDLGKGVNVKKLKLKNFKAFLSFQFFSQRLATEEGEETISSWLVTWIPRFEVFLFSGAKILKSLGNNNEFLSSDTWRI